ncbi:MAG TPA: hypothetical protein VK464_16960 [Symbiobacteriaceae bacterium]|jgi:hypothetical protein|nr:hypothetical protein [Symbiobacteriaceae bacterium]
MEQVSSRPVWQVGAQFALAGAGLWAVVFAGAYAYAGKHGLPLWPTVVTWDEWTVAVGLIPAAFAALLGISSTDDVKNRTGRHMVALAQRLGGLLLVTYVLDLLTRAVFGLGWKPF